MTHTYIQSLVEAHTVPAWLVVSWNSAVLMGTYNDKLSSYIEAAYNFYKARCRNGAVKPLEIWIQEGLAYPMPEWVERRQGDSPEEFIRTVPDGS